MVCVQPYEPSALKRVTKASWLPVGVLASSPTLGLKSSAVLKIPTTYRLPAPSIASEPPKLLICPCMIGGYGLATASTGATDAKPRALNNVIPTKHTRLKFLKRLFMAGPFNGVNIS